MSRTWYLDLALLEFHSQGVSAFLISLLNRYFGAHCANLFSCKLFLGKHLFGAWLLRYLFNVEIHCTILSSAYCKDVTLSI